MIAEDALHLAVAEYLTLAIAPAGLQGVDAVWFSIEHRFAGKVEGAKRKARGVVRGIPDIVVFHDARCIGVELKMPTGVRSNEQKALHLALLACGTMVFVCRSVAEVEAVLRQQGVTMRVRVTT